MLCCCCSEAKRKFFSKSFIKNNSDNLLNDYCPVPNKLNIETTLLGSQSINLPPKSLMCRKIWYRRTRWNPSPSQNFLIPPEQALLKNNELALKVDFMIRGKRVIGLSSDKLLNVLYSANVITADGTFYLTPSL